MGRITGKRSSSASAYATAPPKARTLSGGARSGGSAARDAPAVVLPDDDELEGKAGEEAAEAEVAAVLARYSRWTLPALLRGQLENCKEIFLKPGAS